jgi:hypothetical protein
VRDTICRIVVGILSMCVCLCLCLRVSVCAQASACVSGGKVDYMVRSAPMCVPLLTDVNASVVCARA